MASPLKALTIATIATMISGAPTVLTQTANVFECPIMPRPCVSPQIYYVDNYPDPEDVHRYFECSSEHAFMHVTCVYPPYTFNTTTNVCDGGPDGVVKVNTKRNKELCPPDYLTNSKYCHTLPLATDVTAFYFCTNSGPMIQNCDRNEKYDPTRQTCVPNFNCPSNWDHNPLANYTRIENPYTYIQCGPLGATLKWCGYGEIFNVAKLRCESLAPTAYFNYEEM